MNNSIRVSYDTKSNIVSGDKLHEIQLNVLKDMANAILKSMGPAGSNTLILKGNNAASMVAEYSKDGNKIVSNIKYAGPIEMSIQTEVEQVTRSVEKIVGDGTSTAVVMAYLIFEKMIKNKDIDITRNPFQVMRNFKTVVEKIKAQILSHKRECTVDDIYSIALISTNGNTDVAGELRDIYDQYGMDVFIDVGASVDDNSYVKCYDGLVLDVGYSSNVYINTQEGTSRIANPRIYAFQDPVDTPEMSAFFETILVKNITRHIQTPTECIPTVIVAPRLSRDMSGLLRKLLSWLGQYSADDLTQKPPILVITNIAGISVNLFDNIAQLCGCKMISKYIDPAKQKEDQEKGLAPTLENVAEEWYGTADVVEADANTSRFINPSKMFVLDEEGQITTDENGDPVPSKDYLGVISFIEGEIKRLTETGETVGVIGGLKRQLNALKTNMVEYLVGGVAVSDRDSLRDLVEDAVLNCRSAAKNGVGFGANFEGYRATVETDNYDKNDRLVNYHQIISNAYMDMINRLYQTSGLSQAEVDAIVSDICTQCLQKDGKKNRGPYNIATNKFDGKVLTSIMSDVTILDIISKIITIMVTSNQALVQAPNLNTYTD